MSKYVKLEDVLTVIKGIGLHAQKELEIAIHINTLPSIDEEWVSVETPPKESGRYWCYVKEVNDLGISYFQWNCCYDINSNSWSDNHEIMYVEYWTNLLPNPQPPTK